MGEETFAKFELLKEIGDDGLPYITLQIDIETTEENGSGKKYSTRSFTNALSLKEFLNKNV